MTSLTKPSTKPFKTFTPLPSKASIKPLSLHLSNTHYEPPSSRKLHLPKPLQNPTKDPSRSTTRTPRTIIISRDHVGSHQMWVLCGFGYWVQGFRCFPWLALNFHLVQSLNLSPSTLQMVQQMGNLPLVAKPLFGVISDSVYIGGAHRLPYISIGVFLQSLSWGTLALIPIAGMPFLLYMIYILLGNLGASVTEVANDALVAEFSRAHKAGELQSYAFIASTAGILLGNLSGGFILQNSQEPRIMFFFFAFLLIVQLTLSLAMKETLLTQKFLAHHLAQSSVSENFRQQFSNLITAISNERIFYPLLWVVASVSVVPLLSGPMFCFQTQFLKLDPSIIGMSKVIGQLMVLAATIVCNRFLKQVPIQKLIFVVQTLYAALFLTDLSLVRQINLKLGISNEVHVLCFSALTEALAQFKLLPFIVLFSNLCPQGCEGSLLAFFSSAVCLSSILSCILGIGLASFFGVTAGDYSRLPWAIALQFVAALVPLGWISCLPVTHNVNEMKKSG